MAIIVVESIVVRRDRYGEQESLLTSIRLATDEVAGAVMIAIVTTVISFLPVFTMEAAEGKLFRPLAYTKPFALLASVIVPIFIIPTVSSCIFRMRLDRPWARCLGPVAMAAIAGIALSLGSQLLGMGFLPLFVVKLFLLV